MSAHPATGFQRLCEFSLPVFVERERYARMSPLVPIDRGRSIGVRDHVPDISTEQVCRLHTHVLARLGADLLQ